MEDDITHAILSVCRDSALIYQRKYALDRLDQLYHKLDHMKVNGASEFLPDGYISDMQRDVVYIQSQVRAMK